LNKDSDLPTRPDFVTPIGIAIAAKQNPIHYINVLVNNKNVRMFQLKQLTIGDVLIHTGLKGATFQFRRPDFGWRSAEFKIDRKSTRLNSSHVSISYAVFCLQKN